MVFDIISEKRFQEYLNIVLSMAIGTNIFSWVNATKPWHLKALVKQTNSSHPGLNGDADMAKGIFLLPHEIAEKTWETYTNMPAFRRTFGGSCLLHTSLVKMNPTTWLNDELVNSYLALLPQNGPQGIKIVNSFMFQTLERDNPQSSKEKIARSMVLFIFSLVLFLAQLYQLGGKKNNIPIDQLMAQHRKIFFPVNWDKGHWLLVTLDVTAQQVLFTDSLASFTGDKGRRSIFKVGMACVQIILYPFSDEMQTLQRQFSLSDNWTALSIAAPQQLNTCDCGVYCCQFIKYAYFDRPIPKWDKKDSIKLRSMMILELYEGSLRWFGD